MTYRYLGDKLTRPDLKGQRCEWLERSDGKKLVGIKPRNALVRFENGEVCVVLARRLRKIKGA
jgi:hypothetical protein